MSSSSYERSSPSCNYGLSIHCHSQSLPRGLRAPSEKGCCDDPRSLDLIGHHQPRRDYASGQCLAMLRRGGGGGGGGGGQAGGGREDGRKSHNQNVKTKAKGDGKRRERENIVKKCNNIHFSSFMAGL